MDWFLYDKDLLHERVKHCNHISLHVVQPVFILRSFCLFSKFDDFVFMILNFLCGGLVKSSDALDTDNVIITLSLD